MSAQNGLRSKLQYLLPAMLFIISVAIAIADLAGFLDSNRVPVVTLLIVGIIAGYLGLERRWSGGLERSIEGSMEHLITAFNGVGVETFDRREQFYEFIAKRIRLAENSIDISHFNPTVPGQDSPEGKSKEEAEYERELEKAIDQRHCLVRRVLTLPDRPQKDILAKLVWIENTLAKFRTSRMFHMGDVEDPSFTVLNLMVIDGSEVAIGGSRHSPSEEPKTVWIKHPYLGRIVKDYFDNVLWKECNELNEDRLQQLREKYSTSE